MNWKTKKGYSDKEISQLEYWEIITSWLGLKEKQYNSFIAMFFKDFVNGTELRPGFVRKIQGVLGSVQYITLEEYQPDNFNFTVSISSEYLDPATKYMIIRNSITKTNIGSRWNIEVSEKRKKSILGALTGSKGLTGNIDSMFHGHIHFITEH